MSNIAISFKNIHKSFNQGATKVIEHLSFDVPEGEFITILGTSGSGKTTALKMINRLIEPDAGEIKIYDQPITTFDINQLRRQIGYVVQQIGLFPHYTIEKNIATVPELLGWEKKKLPCASKNSWLVFNCLTKNMPSVSPGNLPVANNNGSASLGL